MTFLNPLYLIALAAAAIPILLHLLNLRKTRVVEFSTLTFLHELQRSRIRKLKLKQWLLLALRTLIIVFMVLAFTRPALRSSLGFLPGTTAKNSVVIILDDSFSMTRPDEGGRLIKQAQQKALSILNLLEPGDEATLVLLSQARERKELTAALGAVRSEIDAVQASYVTGSLSDALIAARLLLDDSKNFNREVYIVSDQQATLFGGSETQPEMFDPAIRVFYIPLESREHDNAAVTDARVESSIFEEGRPVDITATVYNDGPSPMSGAMLSVFLNGERVSQQALDIPGGSTSDVRVAVTPRESGFISGFVELEDDALAEDNRRYFSFHVPSKLNILIGPGNSDAASIVSLGLEPGTDDESASPFVLTVADRSQLLSANLSNFDAVILLGAASLSPAFIERLQAWVRNGGSAMLFPDADGNIQAFTSEFLPRFGIPPTAGSTGSLEGSGTFSTVTDFDFDHPLFRGVFSRDDAKPRIESPTLWFAVRLRADTAAQQVAGTSNGDAFILDSRYGKGKVLVFAVAPDLRWSDFPLKGVFVPLLYRSAFYLASRDDFASDATTGGDLDVLVAGRVPSGTMFDLVSPEGETRRVVPKSLPSGLVFPVDHLDMPGVYTLAAGDEVLRTISVNTDPAESRLARAEDAQRDQWMNRFGITRLSVLDAKLDVQSAIAEARFGVELWKYMLFLALLCAVTEMFIARDVKRNMAEMEGSLKE